MWASALLGFDRGVKGRCVDDGMSRVQRFAPLRLDYIVTDMRRWGGQAVLFQNGPNSLRRPVVVAGELHFFVADLPNLGDRTVEVLLYEIAHGIELQSDAVNMESFS